jgi:hypothetical protein
VAHAGADAAAPEEAVLARPARSLRVTSSGDVPLRIVWIDVDGPDRERFEVVREDCTLRALAPGESCTIEVALRPAPERARSAAGMPPGPRAAAPTAFLDLGGNTPEGVRRIELRVAGAASP